MMRKEHFSYCLNCLLLALLAWVPPAFGADPGSEIEEKEVTEHLNSMEEAKQRLSEPKAFKQWLDYITHLGWQLLDSSETDTAYYALFRSGNYLIVWQARHGAQLGQSSIQITSKENGSVVWDKPPRWVAVQSRFEYPGGALLGRSAGQAFKIKEGFQKTLILDVSEARPDESKSHSVYRREVSWTK